MHIIQTYLDFLILTISKRQLCRKKNKLFAGGALPFNKTDSCFAEEISMFLMTAPCGGNKSGAISCNTAAACFFIFKAALKQAFIDNYLTIDLSAKIKGINFG